MFEFALEPHCEVIIKPREAYQGMVRMEWTLQNFYQAGGPTTFLDRLASTLGIHASEIKIVSVYEGSLVVNYEINDPLDNKENVEKIRV